MKKSLLVLSILFLSVSFAGISAADMNPFAYNLKSEYNPSTLTLTINFTLNAPATYVKLAISNGNTDVWTKEYLASSYSSGKVPKNTYTEVIDVSDLPAGVDLTWRVDVKGAGNGSVQYATYVPIYNAASVDIDNNPENANFGTVFCTDYAPDTKGNANYSSYLCYYDGPGLYIINADATARKMPFQESGKTRYGYNGGVNSDRTAFGSTSKAHTPWRVRVSDDGRIFVTSQTTDGQVLWEAKKACFSATTKAEWQANTGWIKIIADDNANTNLRTTKKTNNDNCNVHSYCNIFNLFTSGGTFIAGPNCGFDVRGSGENLTIVMLSGDKQAIEAYSPAHYRCDEYKLGTATIWEKAPTRNLYWGRALYGEGVQVSYDKTGNVWMCQHRGKSADNVSTLMRYNVSTSTRDYDEDFTLYRRCGGIRFNNDFTQVIIASKGSGGQGGGATLYPVDQATGMPMWTSGTTIQMQSVAGNSLMDFAWDYAGNLYVAGDNGHKLAVYAMPYDASRVITTPAASKYTFSVACQSGAYHTVTTVCNPIDGGSITCTQAGSARVAGVLSNIESCTQLTLTAIPDEGHKFLNWTDENGNVLSSAAEFTFYVTRDITITANFEPAIYTGIVWKNLFLNGEDIADKVSETYKNRNERLWRLFQVEYNAYFSKHVDAGVVNDKFKVFYFLNTAARTDSEETNTTIRTNTENLVDNSNYSFHWLGQYVESLVGRDLGAYTVSGSVYHMWGYYLQAFFNRMGIYNADITQATDLNSLTGFPNTDFTETGKPENWRPFWAEYECKLPRTMKYSDYMPTVVTWNQPSVKSKETDYITPKGSSTKCYGSSWYKWNHPNYDASIKDVDYQKYFILAWRNGSPTANEIVHHVYESNMELHASYVLKNIDENDKVDPTKHDASNDDVIKLMQNRHWVNLDPDPNVHPTHTLTVTRKLQAGMFNTICLPFGVDLTGLQDNNEYHHPLKNAEALEYTGTTLTYNESGEPVVVLNFNTVTQLEAGKPYLIQMKNRNENLREDMTFSSVSCFTDLHPSQGGGLIFEPTINPTTVPAGSLILVADNRLALTTQEGVLSGMRGYFRIDESDPILANDIMEQASAGRVYLSFKKPVTSSVPVAPEAEQQVAPKARKIMRDGNIYILRGDEVYTIGGLRVK